MGGMFCSEIKLAYMILWCWVKKWSAAKTSRAICRIWPICSSILNCIQDRTRSTNWPGFHSTVLYIVSTINPGDVSNSFGVPLVNYKIVQDSWDKLKWTIQNRLHTPNSIHDIIVEVDEAWLSITQETIRNLIGSIPNRGKKHKKLYSAIQRNKNIYERVVSHL